MSNPTPGPWELLPETFSPHIFVVRANASGDDQAIARVLDRRDARLIAAAPELLEALIELHRECVASAERAGTVWPLPSSNPACALDEKCRAAIAKARGEAA